MLTPHPHLPICLRPFSDLCLCTHITNTSLSLSLSLGFFHLENKDLRVEMSDRCLPVSTFHRKISSHPRASQMLEQTTVTSRGELNHQIPWPHASSLPAPKWVGTAYQLVSWGNSCRWSSSHTWSPHPSSDQQAVL